MGLLGRLAGTDKKKKEAKALEKKMNMRRDAALGEMSPENIQALVQLFQQKYMGLLAPTLMNTQQSLGANAKSMGRGGVFQQLKAGLPGQFANMAMSQAIPSAMNVAQTRAGIHQDTPVVSVPKGSAIEDIADWAVSMVSSYYSGGANNRGTANSQPTPQSVF